MYRGLKGNFLGGLVTYNRKNVEKITSNVLISDSHIPSKINIFLHANFIGKFPIVTSGFRNICTYKGGEVEK